MKKIIGLALGLLLTTSLVFGQDNYGYYGKKTFIDFSSSSYFPILYNLTTSGAGSELSPSGNSLQSSEDWFNSGARVSVGRAIKSNVGLAIEFGYDKFTLGRQVLPSSYNYNQTKGIIDHERFRVNSILVMPRVEISGPNGLLPNGLVHQIGFGLTINSLAKQNYLVLYNDGSRSGGPNGEASDQADLFKTYDLDKSMKMIQLMYGLKMRTPLGKSLMFNYGFRYTIDLGTIPFELNRELAREIRSYQFRNLIAFDLGLTLPF